MTNTLESQNFESPKIESLTLRDTEAANWLEQRELYDPSKQTPPKEILIVKLDETLTTLLGTEKKVISSKLLLDFLHDQDKTINIFSVDFSLNITGIKVVEDTRMSVVFPIRY